MVDRTQPGEYGLVAGYSALGSVVPITCPILSPPPAQTIDMAPGQWSRPAVGLIRGVRPNSPNVITSTFWSSPRLARSVTNAATAWSYLGSRLFLSCAKLSP